MLHTLCLTPCSPRVIINMLLSEPETVHDSEARWSVQQQHHPGPRSPQHGARAESTAQAAELGRQDPAVCCQSQRPESDLCEYCGVLTSGVLNLSTRPIINIFSAGAESSWKQSEQDKGDFMSNMSAAPDHQFQRVHTPWRHLSHGSTKDRELVLVFFFSFLNSDIYHFHHSQILSIWMPASTTW